MRRSGWEGPPLHIDEGEALLARFKSIAAARYCGSLVAVWRCLLDVRNIGRVGFSDIVRAGRALGFMGNYRLLWQELISQEELFDTRHTSGGACPGLPPDCADMSSYVAELWSIRPSLA